MKTYIWHPTVAPKLSLEPNYNFCSIKKWSHMEKRQLNLKKEEKIISNGPDKLTTIINLDMFETISKEIL